MNYKDVKDKLFNLYYEQKKKISTKQINSDEYTSYLENLLENMFEIFDLHFDEKVSINKLMDFLDKGVMVLDKDKKVLLLNNIAAQILEKEKSKIVDFGIHNFIKGEVHDSEKCLICRSIENLIGNDLEYYDPYIEKYLKLKTHPVVKNSELEYLFVSIDDITEKKNYEIELTHKLREIEKLNIELESQNSTLKRTLFLVNEKEKSYKRLFENMNSGVAIFKAIGDGEDFEILDFNKCAQNITKTSIEEIRGKMLSKLFPKIKETPLFSSFVRCFTEKRNITLAPFYYEDDVRKGWRDGIIYLLEADVLVSVFNDVSESMSYKNLIINQNKELESIYNSFPSGIVFMGNNRKIVNFNRAFSELTGFSKNDLISQKIDLIFDNEFIEKITKYTIKTNKDTYFDVSLEKKNKDKIVCNLKILNVNDSYGNLIGLLLIINDVTDIKFYKEKLNESEYFLSEAQRITRIGYFAYYLEKDLWFCSDILKEILGIQSNDVLTYDFWLSLIAEEDRDRMDDYYKDFLKNRETIFDCEYKVFNRVEVKKIVVHGKAIFSNTQGRTKIVGTIQDVTEKYEHVKKIAETEKLLAKSQKMEAIGQLAGGIAHDFNNQLMGINGFAELILNKALDETTKNYAANIIKSVNYASDLTTKLLAFAREGKYLDIPIDINKIISEVVTILRHSVDRQITVIEDFSVTNACVIGDPNQLQNILLNLGLNSRDAMPNGGTIVYRSDVIEIEENDLDFFKIPLSKGKYVLIEVSDNGLGIRKEIQEKIFDPFFTTKPLGKGTGLGLSAVYGTIKNHGGFIDLDSELGKGTSFFIYLPLSSDKEYFENQNDRNIENIRGEGKVLIIDDERSILNVMGESLKELGYTPIVFDNPIVALDYYVKNKNDISIILLDLIMPFMDGIKTFYKLKEINKKAKIVIISGFSINKNIKQLLKDGASGFLMKPCSGTQLSKTISDILNDKS
ncbi:MAG: PAS domain S-box protein [Candidatus Delongbacteria bacterium]|nr:PAS domain S-box protein [Candidatus Delongbacteria bacterium]MBN2836027.1 PAS domain S-box protein [Candidatus Delongbacteria bacterium]